MWVQRASLDGTVKFVQAKHVTGPQEFAVARYAEDEANAAPPMLLPAESRDFRVHVPVRRDPDAGDAATDVIGSHA